MPLVMTSFTGWVVTSSETLALLDSTPSDRLTIQVTVLTPLIPIVVTNTDPDVLLESNTVDELYGMYSVVVSVLVVTTGWSIATILLVLGMSL